MSGIEISNEAVVARLAKHRKDYWKAINNRTGVIHVGRKAVDYTFSGSTIYMDPRDCITLDHKCSRNKLDAKDPNQAVKIIRSRHWKSNGSVKPIENCYIKEPLIRNWDIIAKDIVVMILLKLDDIQSVIRFSITCKRLYEIYTCFYGQYILVHDDIVDIVTRNCLFFQEHFLPLGNKCMENMRSAPLKRYLDNRDNRYQHLNTITTLGNLKVICISKEVSGHLSLNCISNCENTAKIITQAYGHILGKSVVEPRVHVTVPIDYETGYYYKGSGIYKRISFRLRSEVYTKKLYSINVGDVLKVTGRLYCSEVCYISADRINLVSRGKYGKYAEDLFFNAYPLTQCGEKTTWNVHAMTDVICDGLDMFLSKYILPECSNMPFTNSKELVPLVKEHMNLFKPEVTEEVMDLYCSRKSGILNSRKPRLLNYEDDSMNPYKNDGEYKTIYKVLDSIFVTFNHRYYGHPYTMLTKYRGEYRENEFGPLTPMSSNEINTC